MSDIFIGVMSGTSMDAIDLVAASFENPQPTLHATMTVALPLEYKERYMQIIDAGACNLNDLGDLDKWSGEVFAAAILEFITAKKLNKPEIAAIGSHGQTLWHAPRAPRPFTMQIGDPNVIAVQTGITTIADFRRADIAAGGGGAPLAPVFHAAVFADLKQSRCIVNVGGMSNISVLENARHFGFARGFDSGPGNCLMDHVAKTYFKQEYDRDGAIAANGTVNETLLQAMLADPYFKLAPPKSTGREDFNAAWLQKFLTTNLKPEDLMATLLQLTARSIADAARNYAAANTQMFLCGGGAKNTALIKELSNILEHQVQTTAALGIDPTWVEAALFAWLAQQCLNGNAINTPEITGATHPVILGGIYRQLI